MSDAAQFPVNFPCYTLHTSPPADVRNALPRFSGITYLNHPRVRNRVSRRRRKEVKKKEKQCPVRRSRTNGNKKKARCTGVPLRYLLPHSWSQLSPRKVSVTCRSDSPLSSCPLQKVNFFSFSFPLPSYFCSSPSQFIHLSISTSQLNLNSPLQLNCAEVGSWCFPADSESPPDFCFLRLTRLIRLTRLTSQSIPGIDLTFHNGYPGLCHR